MFYKAYLNQIVAEGEEAKAETKKPANKKQAAQQQKQAEKPKVKKKDQQVTMTRKELQKKTRLSKAIKKNPFTVAGMGAAAAGAGFMAHKIMNNKPRHSEYNYQSAGEFDNHFINYLFSQEGAENSITASILHEAWTAQEEQ